jgi:hypothetical protein
MGTQFREVRIYITVEVIPENNRAGKFWPVAPNHASISDLEEQDRFTIGRVDE